MSSRLPAYEHGDGWYRRGIGVSDGNSPQFGPDGGGGGGDDSGASEYEPYEEQPEILEECCACDEAKYEMIFEGLWSKHKHPREYPEDPRQTHFSDIIGASHSSDFRMWEYGGYASDGVRQVAELGLTKKLESELKAESEKIR